ncbi:MAG: hypothetical protein ACYS80_16335 [Planctomycetota bacterium]|jgi:hypothetical protein
MGVSRNILERLLLIERLMQWESENVNAAEYVPEDMQPHQLPIFVNFPAGSARARKADTFYEITRNWTLSLIFRKEGDGGRAENEYIAMELSDLVYDLFVSRPRLEYNGLGVTSVLSAPLTGDNGYEIRPYPVGADDSAAFYVVDYNMAITYRSTCI